MSNTLPSLEKFDLEGDSASVGQRWERWERSLHIYLKATNIKCPVKKRATLLLLGESSLQEIFCNLPGANAEMNNKTDGFAVAVQKFDDFYTKTE